MFYKAVPTQDVTNPVNLPSFYCLQHIPILLDSMQYFSTSHTICPAHLLQHSAAPHINNFPDIYDLRSEVSRFQHQAEVCSKCCTSLACFLQFGGEKCLLLLLLECCFFKTILDLIPCVQFASVVIMVPK